MSSSTKPKILAVAGAWHQASHLEFMIPHFEALGYETRALANMSACHDPSVTTEDDAANIRRAIQDELAKDKTVIVLVHSYAGVPGCAAIRGLSLRTRAFEGLPGGVVGIIFLAAVLMPSGTCLNPDVRGIERAAWIHLDTPRPGLSTARDPIAHFYAPDTPDEIAKAAAAQVVPQSRAANEGDVPEQSWSDEGYDGRRAYIRCSEDRAILPAIQDRFLGSIDGTINWIVRTLEGAGHSPFLSQPERLARVVDDIVQQFAAN